MKDITDADYGHAKRVCKDFKKLMVEKGIRGRIYHSFYRYAKANKKYMKDYDKKNKNHHIFNIRM